MLIQSYKYNTKKPESTSMSGLKSEKPALSLKVKFQQNLYMHLLSKSQQIQTQIVSSVF